LRDYPRHDLRAPIYRRLVVKFAMEVLSLFAFLLGAPLYLPRMVESASIPSTAAPAAPNPQPTRSPSSLPLPN